MKKYLIVFFIFTISYLTAEKMFLNKNQLDSIPKKTLFLIYEDPENISGDINEWKQFFIENNFILSSNLENAEKIVKITNKKKLTPQKWFNFSQKYNKITTIEISDVKSGKIEFFRNYKSTPINLTNLESKWYDKFMLTAIISGLIYLFYFGNS